MSSNQSNSNIEKICHIETQFQQTRSQAERVGDFVARQAGKMSFIVVHAEWFTLWIGLNLNVGSVRAFDPFPFSFLTFVVSLEAIFLSLFILMSQNRSSRLADVRGHLDLQINLLAEQESTKTLQLLQRLCEHHGVGIGPDSELEWLQTSTKPEELLRDLQSGLPEC